MLTTTSERATGSEHGVGLGRCLGRCLRLGSRASPHDAEEVAVGEALRASQEPCALALLVKERAREQVLLALAAAFYVGVGIAARVADLRRRGPQADNGAACCRSWRRHSRPRAHARSRARARARASDGNVRSTMCSLLRSLLL
jgi:hypothetical protein